MSYFDNFVNSISTILPIVIEDVEWNGTAIYIGGKDWHFNSLSDWVVTDNLVMLKGCHDEGSEDFLKGLISRKIIEIKPATFPNSYDPIFILDNNLRITIFSTSILEPWTFRSEKYIFVASPGDPNWVASSIGL